MRTIAAIAAECGAQSPFGILTVSTIVGLARANRYWLTRMGG